MQEVGVVRAIDGLHESVGGCIKNEEVAVGNAWVLDDIDNVAYGEDIVVGDGVIGGVEGDKIAVDLARSA